MQGKFKFTGDGGEFFSLLFVNALLTMFTLGIYYPWAMVKVMKYLSDHLTFDDKKFSFSGTGGDLFCVLFVQSVLIVFTGGIYAPWAVLKMRKFYTENTSLDEKPFSFNDENGCDFWCVLFVQQLLCGITLGIYTPWAMINIWNEILKRTSYEGKNFKLDAEGSQLFSLVFGQGFLVLVTLGIYGPWAYARIANYLIGSLKYGEDSQFEATLLGPELFSLFFIHGGILIALTLGIYYPWYRMKWYGYASDHIEVKSVI